MQLPLFSRSAGDASDDLNWLHTDRFNVSKRFYETEETYQQRIKMTCMAYQLDYRGGKWFSIADCVEMCPTGPQDRLRKDDATEYGYLEIKNVQVTDWAVLAQLVRTQGNLLPKRATYIAREGDIFLSRFKQPLGKCVIYKGSPSRLVASSNFLLLRSRGEISALLLLGILKSSFTALQLHRIIRHRTVITEMYQRDAPSIQIPNLPSAMQEEIIRSTQRRLDIETQYRNFAASTHAQWDHNEWRRLLPHGSLIFRAVGQNRG